jgi:hypothetical protein
MGSLRDLRHKEQEEMEPDKFSFSDMFDLLASLTFEEKQQLYQNLEAKPEMTVRQFMDQMQVSAVSIDES